MKKTPLIISTFVLIALGAGSFLAFQKSNNAEILQTTENQTQNNSSTSSNTGGSYVDYQEDIITKTTGKKVLFFYAPWCQQCRAIEADIKKHGVPEGFTIFKIDYDSSQELRNKYGVKIQTTFVSIDDKGDKIDLYVAYDEPTLNALKRNILE